MRTILLALVITLVSTVGVAPARADGSTTYSAIARSPSTGASGTASHYQYEAVARSEAEIACGQVDCAWILSGTDDHVLALASTRDGRTVSNWGTSWPELRDSLLADCRAYYGDDAGCRIQSAAPQ